MRPVLASVVVVALLVACPEPSGALADRRTRALALLDEGMRRLALGTLDQRSSPESRRYSTSSDFTVGY
jgi:hypothetical protein